MSLLPSAGFIRNGTPPVLSSATLRSKRFVTEQAVPASGLSFFIGN